MQPAQLSLPLLSDHAPKTPPTAMIALPEPALTDPAGTKDSGDE